MSEAITTDPVPTPPASDSGRTAKLISASAVMAAGTALSRVMGFFRLILLVFLFGNGTRQAEMFTLANTVPNSMYILLAGGVLNTVLVPQIVRAIRSDPDRGDAYTNRIVTAGLLVLGVITVLLTLAVPLVIQLYSAGGWKDPSLSAQYDSMIMLAYYCMPQVFFYGVYVLAGQVLNARDKFGPMMWAPIANNVISIMVLLLFWIVFGRTNTSASFTPAQELLLGLGSTLGIAAQAAVLIPFLRAAGYRYHPRWDFRHTGLGKTFRLAKWTLGFVLVTQAALVVVSKLASGATVGGQGAGLTAYYNAYAVWILPHSLITVSLATAMLPAASRLAAAGDLAGVADETMRAIRLAVTALLPAAVGFLVLGLPISHLVFGFGRGARDAGYVGGALMALAIGLVPFTIQYICLRAFYALEDNRTTFFLQCLIAGANVGLGLATVFLLDRPSLVATGLAASYSAAYLIGVVVSFGRLRRRLPDLNADELIRHCVRLLLAVAPGAAVAWLLTWVLTAGSASKPVLVLVLVLAGLAAVALFLITARMLKIREVSEIVAMVTRSRGRRGSPPVDPTVAVPSVGNELEPDGDSATVIRTTRDSIESTSPPAHAAEAPSGPTENAESMAQAVVAQHIAASLPAGTVLASRYRLEELISEAGPTVTWRAFDQVLSRSVLVHLLSPVGSGGDPEADHPGESELLAAARQASVATDSRFVRVLDAVQSTDPDLGSYIVCEYTTGQSLEMILSHAPLSGLEAAWVVREVADALAGVHSLGLYHRRINPDTVIITPTGNVKIVGLLIEAALRPADGTLVHGADSPELVDVTDLGRLLYACLVSRWPGGPAFSLSDAPVIGRRWGTPRQVRAGVSPSLDNVCDQILGDPPRHRANQITTAHGVVSALTKVLGSADASGDLERRLKQPIPQVGGRSEQFDRVTGAPPVSSLMDQPTEPVVRRTDRRPPAHLPPPHRPVAAASAHRGSTTTTLGPAAAGDSGVSTVIRPPAVPGSAKTGQPGTNRTRTGRHPRRWIGLLIVLVLVLVTAGAVSARLLDRRLTAGAPPAASTKPSAGSETSPPPTAADPLTIAGARDFDPEGDAPKTENPDEVKFAYDGDRKTRWRTVQYLGSPQLGGIKRGVGLILDLGSAQPVRTVELALSGTGTNVEFRVPSKDPSAVTKPPMASDKSWRTVAKQSKAGATATLTAAEPVTTRYVLVYLTSLPKEGRGYRGGIYEVEVRQ